jgi:hypothetical protein
MFQVRMIEMMETPTSEEEAINLTEPGGIKKRRNIDIKAMVSSNPCYPIS